MASTVTKKNSLCRYFVRYGDCFHGENCQFIHAYPPQQTPQPQPPQPTETRAPPTPLPQSQNIQTPVPPPVQQQGFGLNKLICSFKSDLPNEIDFAMQAATLLANTDNFTWSKDFPLVDAICSSLHVFVCVCGNKSTCYCYPRFWHKIIVKNACNNHLKISTLHPDREQSYLKYDTLVDHDIKDHNKIYRRIKTVAELIKQFSMMTGLAVKEDNRRPQQQPELNHYNYLQIKKKKQKASPSLLKFVSLLLHCDDTPLNLIGLDIISNIASKLSKISDTNDDTTCKALIQMFQEYCIDSICRPDGDIYIINRSIEVVSKLISSSSISVLTTMNNFITERNLIHRIEQFLTSQSEVTLFLSALECCYCISSHQPQLLTTGGSRYLTRILINLLNCDENRYFTRNALKKIKLANGVEPSSTSGSKTAPKRADSDPVAQPILRVIEPKALVPKTSQPKAQEPKASEPKAPEPKAPERQPSEPKAPEPKASEPKAPEPKAPEPKAPEPKASEPHAPEPMSSEPQVSETKATEPMETESMATESMAIEPKAAEPKASEPDASEPQEQEPKVSKPPVQEPKVSEPRAQEPLASGPKDPEPKVSEPKTLEPAKGYLCKWDGCEMELAEAKQVYPHVFDVHISSLPSDAPSSCLWSSPNGSGPGCLTKRPKYSLLTHLNDFHCNQAALERSQPIEPPKHPGYAPNAALLAIRRHVNANLEATNGTSKGSPLSTSVRLTAALILRNLAIESTETKQALENHEPLLSEICMTNGRDESKIIAECLGLFSKE